MATPGTLTARTSGRDRDRRAALAIVTSAFSAMLLAANLATPLYAVWALMFVPETASRPGGALRIRRPRVPAEIRGAFARVSLILAGAGHGVAFLAAQDDLTRIAPAQQRAEVSAAFYVCIYLGVSWSRAR